MISVNSVSIYCNDIENIEGYDKAVVSEEMYECHHRLETHTSDGERRTVDLCRKELIALGMYYHRPASELIFITCAEHVKLHKTGNRLSEETKRKIAESHKGIQHTEEWKISHSDAMKGTNNPFYGKQHSEETKRKIAEAHKGRHWYNNGEVSVTANECPEGFVKGRICKLIDGKKVYR